MAEQKPVEIAEPVVAEAPAATPAVAEAKDSEPVAQASTVAETAAEPAAEPVADQAKKLPDPVEEGHIEHKGQGANFPKNLIFSKKFIWFGSEPVDLKSISQFKADKVADVAHHCYAWASETGKGLLFYSDKDKTAPQGAIHLADASEPTTEGNTKFHFTAKGQKHSFKAASTAERDNWVVQLKLKMAEAKQLATTVTESETYKKTLESLKPKKETAESKTPKKETAESKTPKKETAESKTPKKETAESKTPKKETGKKDAPATPAVAAATDHAIAAAPVEESTALAETTAASAVAEAAKEETKKAAERRSASRKRASVFGNIFGGKKEEEKKTVEPVNVKTEEVKAAEPEAPSSETTPAETETAPGPTAEANSADAATEKKEEAPKPVKRQSIFGNLSFTKKKSAVPEAPKEVSTTVTEPVAETAPVIPAVEPTEPLSAEVSSPANVPVETNEASPAAAAMKSDKRKSSLPFAFGKKEKATSDEEGEKAKTPGPFSKLRATIKGGKKADEKKDDAPEVPAIPTEAGVVKAEEPSAAGEPTTEAAAGKKEKSEAKEPAVEPKVDTATPVTAAA